MPTSHVRPEEERILVRLQGPQLGHIFGRLEVLDLGILQPRRHEQGRVFLGLDLVVGRIREHVVVVFFDLGIPPFVELPGRQRDRLVQHGRDDVDERNADDGALEEVRPHVDDGAHEQPPGAPAFGPYGGKVT